MKCLICGQTESSVRRRLRGSGGHRIGEDWFCSEGCLEDGLQPHIERHLARPSSAQRASSLRPTLGLILLAQGHLTKKELQEALSRQKGSSQKLGELLQNLGAVTERDVTLALSRQFGIPWVNFTDGQISSSLISSVPTIVARTYSAVPIKFHPEGRKMLVAIVGPPDYQLLHALSRMVEVDAIPLVADESKIRELLDTYYPEKYAKGRLKKMPLKDVSIIGRWVASMARGFPEHEVKLERCRYHLWVRFEREKRCTDYLVGLPSEVGKSCRQPVSSGLGKG